MPSRPIARSPLPPDFLEWQVALRRFTMERRGGQPHVGVAPLLCVRRPGSELGIVAHSIICGLLPAVETLEASTAEFRRIYEEGIAQGARSVYDQGLAHLRTRYERSSDYESDSVTTLLSSKLPVVDSLRADPRCALVFHVFELVSRDPLERYRCIQIDARAEVLESGPVYDNVWWHNTMFHGPADDHVVVHFRHRRSFETGFGRLDSLAS